MYGIIQLGTYWHILSSSFEIYVSSAMLGASKKPLYWYPVSIKYLLYVVFQKLVWGKNQYA